MSRCDDYCCNHGCNQGRNCPARVARVGIRMQAAQPLPPATWRRHLKDLARALLLVIFALLASSIPVFFLS